MDSNFRSLSQIGNLTDSGDPNSIPPVQAKKPVILNVVSILFVLIALLYIMGELSFLFALFILEKTIALPTGIKFITLSNFPLFSSIPLFYAFTVLIFTYIAIKVRNGSKFSFWLGIITSLILPLVLTFLVKLGISEYTQTSQIEELGKTYSFLYLLNPVFLLLIAALSILAFSYRKFSFKNYALSKKAKILLMVIFMTLVLPVALYLTYGFCFLKTTDYGYSKAQSSVSYHVYRPAYLPQKLQNATSFSAGNALADNQNAVKVGYSWSFREAMKSGNSKFIFLAEAGVGSDFDLNNYLDTVGEKETGSRTVTEEPLTLAQDHKAYLIERVTEKSHFMFLVFVTPDNVLIQFNSTLTDKTEIMKMAESLN